jgi:hypothetical protein
MVVEVCGINEMGFTLHTSCMIEGVGA